MNPIAQELNQVLSNNVCGRLLSDFGKEIFFPRGIVAQAAEAASKAKRFDATIGMAVEARQPMVLPVVAQQVPGLGPREVAAYAPAGGVLSVREGWLEQMRSKNPNLDSKTCSLPMVVPGLTNGIFQCADLFFNVGDTIIIPNMHWDNYELIFETRRNVSIAEFDLFNEAGGFNLKALEQALDANTPKQGHKRLAVLLNFPNNPTGYSPNKAEAQAIAAILTKKADQGVDILVICDDAYFGLFYEKETNNESLFAQLAKAHERILAIKVDGSTKEDFVWGFRLGFVTFGNLSMTDKHFAAILQKLMGSIRSSISNSSGLGQFILKNAYEHPSYPEQKSAAFKKLEARYFEVKKIIANYKDSPGTKVLKPLPFNSGYFMSFDCYPLNAEKLRQALLERGIGTINLKDRYLRVAYSAIDLAELATLYEEIFLVAAQLAV